MFCACVCEIKASSLSVCVQVTPDCVLPVGTPIYATHFVPGQLVDVCGISKGKGFQGAMKRWNFKGGRASHGNSLSHRVLGSTGCRQDPGKVFKGKKMPGRMGTDRITVQNLRVLKIDVTRNLLYVKGAVPGQKGAFLRVTDAVKGPFYPDASTVPPASSDSSTISNEQDRSVFTGNIYNPYTVPYPTMSTAEYRSLLDMSAATAADVSGQANDSMSAARNRNIGKSTGDKRAKKGKRGSSNKSQGAQDSPADATVAGAGADGDGTSSRSSSARKQVIVSLWANTSGVNGIPSSGGVSVEEIDPGKGVEVLDPYTL